MNIPLLGGKVFDLSIAAWQVTWESRGPYRHWAHLFKPEYKREILVVMKNPGSLSGDGSNVKRDSTLRVLRKIGDCARTNVMVANLFDFADPKPDNLHANWQHRDGEKLVYAQLAKWTYHGILFAHGDPEPLFRTDYVERIAQVRSVFSHVPEIACPVTKAGNPMHPLSWQRQNQIPQVIAATRSLLRE